MNLKEKILHVLGSERFAKWYGGRFDNYIRVEYPEGDPKHVSKEDIMDDIERMFTAPEVPMEMMLCEQDSVILRPDQVYVFKHDPTCPSCCKIWEQLQFKHVNKPN